MSNNRKIRKKCDRKNNIERGVINSVIKNLSKETGDIFICTKCNRIYALPTKCDHYQQKRIDNLLEAVEKGELFRNRIKLLKNQSVLPSDYLENEIFIFDKALEKDKHIKKR